MENTPTHPESSGSQASPVAIWAALIAVYITWGSTYLAIHYAIQTIPPFLMAGVRFLIAGVCLYLYRRMRGDPRPTLRQWKSALIIGVLLLLGGNGGISWAEQRLTTSVAAIVVGSSPLWMILMDAFRPGRRPSLPATLGVITGFAGIVILVSPWSLNGVQNNLDPFSVGVLLLAAFLWAAGSLYSREAVLPSSPLMGTAMEMLCGSAALIAAGSLTGEWVNFHPAAVSGASLLGLGYLVVFGSIVGFGAYTWLFRAAPTSLVSTYAYVNPIVAILLGSLFGSEAITPRILIAATIILGAVAVITLTQKKPAVLPEEAV
jgi:drug/metabolite transporter (DMT)-like permease